MSFRVIQQAQVFAPLESYTHHRHGELDYLHEAGNDAATRILAFAGMTKWKNQQPIFPVIARRHCRRSNPEM